MSLLFPLLMKFSWIFKNHVVNVQWITGQNDKRHCFLLKCMVKLHSIMVTALASWPWGLGFKCPHCHIFFFLGKVSDEENNSKIYFGCSHQYLVFLFCFQSFLLGPWQKIKIPQHLTLIINSCNYSITTKLDL